MTVLMIVFDTVAAFTFIVLMTLATRDQEKIPARHVRWRAVMRRLVYSGVSAALGWRAYDLLLTSREVPLPAVVVNVSLVGGFLFFAIARRFLTKPPTSENPTAAE